jgi:hypothetical protein
MPWFGALLAVVGASVSGADVAWPVLPTSGFITGRVATEADIKRGDAVFLTESDGKPDGEPASIRIPQYAYLIEGDSKRRPVVVVQAQTNERGTILGMRDANGKEYVATREEVVLLGLTHH